MQGPYLPRGAVPKFQPRETLRAIYAAREIKLLAAAVPAFSADWQFSNN
jgi:hypothetical protein